MGVIFDFAYIFEIREQNFAWPYIAVCLCHRRTGHFRWGGGGGGTTFLPEFLILARKKCIAKTYSTFGKLNMFWQCIFALQCNAVGLGEYYTLK